MRAEVRADGVQRGRIVLPPRPRVSPEGPAGAGRPGPGEVELTGVDLPGVDLNGVDLTGVDLSGVDLSGVDPGGENGLPLARYLIFRSSDLEEAREHAAGIFRPHELALAGNAGRLDARQHTARLQNLSMNYVHYGDDVRIVTGELESFVVVQVPLSGHALVNRGLRQILSAPGVASVSCPSEPLAMWWSADCAQLIVRIERRALESELSDLLNRSVDDPIRFDLAMDLISAPTYTWHSTARLLVADLDRGDGLASHPVAVANFEHLLMAGLLVAQPNSYTRLLTASSQPSGSRAVKEAVALMESHPEQPLTVGSIARKVAVSVRSLQEGFRRHVGCTPTEYLREVRLRRAHRDLVTADPRQVAVTDVAYRWGFTHVGRFSVNYRRRYGEPPSWTLRR